MGVAGQQIKPTQISATADPVGAWNAFVAPGVVSMTTTAAIIIGVGSTFDPNANVQTSSTFDPNVYLGTSSTVDPNNPNTYLGTTTVAVSPVTYTSSTASQTAPAQPTRAVPGQIMSPKPPGETAEYV